MANKTISDQKYRNYSTWVHWQLKRLLYVHYYSIDYTELYEYFKYVLCAYWRDIQIIDSHLQKPKCGKNPLDNIEVSKRSLVHSKDNSAPFREKDPQGFENYEDGQELHLSEFDKNHFTSKL